MSAQLFGFLYCIWYGFIILGIFALPAVPWWYWLVYGASVAVTLQFASRVEDWALRKYRDKP